MNRTLLICLCIMLSLVGGVISFAFFSSEVKAQGNGIIVEDADFVSTTTTEYSSDLNDIAKIVTPRVVVEYADFNSRLDLNMSDDLNQIARAVSPRIIVEYADSIFQGGLQSVIVPDIPPRIIVAYADAILTADLEQPFGTTVTGIEKSFTESSFVENLLAQKAVLNNVPVTGDLEGTLNFTNFEIVSITTGSFAGKGFSKGQWEATLEGLPYEGDWRGALLLKPSERKIYLKGSVSGDIAGTVEGYLTESVTGSNIYDLYQATWTVGRVKVTTTSAIISMKGTLTYQSESEFPTSEIYALQTSIEGTSTGHYNCPLSIVLTHLRIVNGAPYAGEGFSIISYISNFGAGNGWTYDTHVSPDTIRMKGLFEDPLFGIVSATLDESKLPRTLILQIERVDLGLPPMARLKVKTWGPERVSPGQTIDYIIEYKNDGFKAAEDVIIVCRLPYEVEHVSNMKGNYVETKHEVIWHFENIPPKSVGLVSIKARVLWGLSGGTSFETIVGMLKEKVEVQIDPSISVDQEIVEMSEEYLECIVNISNQTHTGTLFMNATRANVPEAVEPTFDYIETADWIEVRINFTMTSNSFTQIVAELGMPLRFASKAHAVYEFIEFNRVRVENQAFLDWLLSEDLMSEHMYGVMSRWNTGSFYFKIALKSTSVVMSLKYPAGFGAAILWDLTILRQAKITTQKFFEISTGRAIYEHSGGSIPPKWEKDSTFLNLCYRLYIDTYKLHLREISHSVDSHRNEVTVARDPNIKYGPEGHVSAGQTLNYTVEYENEGEGTAFGVYFTDVLDEDLDDSTLEIGQVISTMDGSVLAGPGTYDPSTRTITWLAGEVGPGEGGYAHFSVKVRDGAPEGTEIINYATVYFPSVPETTQTNAIVSVVGQPNIAITDVSPSELVIDIGSTVFISVTVLNEGYFAEILNITLYLNTTAIETKSVFLPPRSSDTLIFLWNTTDSTIGNYTISAHAQPVIGETDIDDNTLEFFPVQVIPEFPSAALLPMLVLLSAAAVVLAKKKHLKKTQT